MKRPVDPRFPGVRYHAGDDADEAPRLALRRYTDRCFFEVQEVVHHGDGRVAGFVVEGHLIDAEEVADLRETGPNGGALCEPLR